MWITIFRDFMTGEKYRKKSENKVCLVQFVFRHEATDS